VLFAADLIKRSAIIVDKSGVTTEVTGLHFAGSDALNNKVLESPDDMILIETEPLIIGIPLGRLISIELEGKTNKATYLWKGQKITISEDIYSVGDFKGKSSFGDFSLRAPSLKRLILKEGISSTYDKNSISYDATIVFANDTRLPVANLRRFHYYCSSEGYAFGCRNRYDHTTDFEFKKGDSILKGSFTDNKLIEFKNVKIERQSFIIEGMVFVTRKDGKSTDGIITATFNGLTGICDKGEFFVAPAYVKRVEFN